MARSRSIRKESEPEGPSDIILPSQYFAGLRQGRPASGEPRLMLALLNDAIFCLLIGNDRRRGAEVQRWLAGGSSAVSFEQACHALGLDPGAIRTGIEKLALNEDSLVPRTYLKRKHRSG